MSELAIHNEAGFTLTELVAALLVASLLIAGLVDLTHRYATGSVRARTAIEAARASQVVQDLMSRFGRIDPESLEVTPTRAAGSIGGQPVEARLVGDGTGRRRLEWRSFELRRSVEIDPAARFDLGTTGVLRLLGPKGAPPLAVVAPKRNLKSDCEFDPLVRKCR